MPRRARPPALPRAAEAARTIAVQNDEFRFAMETHPDIPGHVVLSQGVLGRGVVFTRAATLAVTVFDGFTDETDPASEHDRGVVEIGGERVLWRIELYDPDLCHAPRDRTDPGGTVRVLTIMLAGEC